MRGRCEDILLRNAARALATVEASGCADPGAPEGTGSAARTPAPAIPSSTATTPTRCLFTLEVLDDPKMILLNGFI
jgi:hypothetical protein